MSNASIVEDLFFAALDKGAMAERAAFLDSACAGDAELRRQVEKLLKAHFRLGDFLNKPVIEQMPAASEGSATRELDASTLGDATVLAGPKGAQPDPGGTQAYQEGLAGTEGFHSISPPPVSVRGYEIESTLRARRHGRRLPGPAQQPQPPRRPQDDPGRPPAPTPRTCSVSSTRPRPAAQLRPPRTSCRSTRSASTTASLLLPWSSSTAAAWRPASATSRLPPARGRRPGASARRGRRTTPTSRASSTAT